MRKGTLARSLALDRHNFRAGVSQQPVQGFQRRARLGEVVVPVIVTFLHTPESVRLQARANLTRYSCFGKTGFYGASQIARRESSAGQLSGFLHSECNAADTLEDARIVRAAFAACECEQVRAECGAVHLAHSVDRSR